MAVDDRWYLSKRAPDGERLKSTRYGRGKRYRVRYTDDGGRPRERLFDRKAAAEAYDANVRADVSRGQYVDPQAGKLTVAEHAVAWARDQLHTDTTAVRVETAIRLHIATTVLGRLALKDVRPSHVQAWVKDRSTVLAPTTMRLVYGYLVSMFAAAALDRRIGSSPCAGVRLPEVERRGHFIPTPEQVHALAAALPDRLAASVYLAAGCGLRLGEALGLELSDVDFLRREVHIVRQHKAITGRKPYLGALKTKTSRRTVELPDTVANWLAWHIKEHPPAEAEVDDETDPRKPVRRKALLLFVSASGEPMQRASWSRIWASAAKSLGLPPRTGYHALRHHFATLLIHAGASVKTVQLALGHSNPMITLNTYAGEWPDALDRTRSLVDAALGKTTTAHAAAGART